MQFIEPIAVQDVFVTGLARVEKVGGDCLRFTFYSQQKSFYGEGVERVICARLIIPTDALAAIRGHSIKATQNIEAERMAMN